jgi:imidazole glycerol phosphate synthase glutamine amidotransferase subunit
MKVGIVDYGRGNIRSVENAFLAIGADTVLITSPEQLQDITHLVLPGQGEFGDCAANLKKQGMFEAIQKWTSEDKPYLGICVGYQLIFEKSVESPSTEGLAILPGTVKRFPDVDLKIPHMGWNSISPSHPDDGLWCDYAVSFAAAVRRGNLVATQFHPEKSQHNGLQLLRNFLATTS